jgi:hypothetical protein
VLSRMRTIAATRPATSAPASRPGTNNSTVAPSPSTGAPVAAPAGASRPKVP